MLIKLRKGQSTLEYAVIMAVVVAALVSMQVFMKRGVQGKLKDSADRIGDHYAAGNTEGTYTTQYNSGGQSVTVETTGYNAYSVNQNDFDSADMTAMQNLATSIETEEQAGVSHYNVQDEEEVTVTGNEDITLDYGAEQLFY